MRMVRKTQDGQGQFLHNLIMEILGLVLTQLPNPTTDLYPAAVLSDATLEFVLSVDSGFSKNVLCDIISKATTTNSQDFIVYLLGKLFQVLHMY